VSEFTKQCFCCASNDVALYERCVVKGHCVFVNPVTAKHARQPKDQTTLVGVLTDYFGGVSNREIRRKWNVSGGYIYKKLARAGVANRPAVKVENQKLGRVVTIRKLIPFAGKEKGNGENY
jgi:hypothetical protein